MVVVSDTEPAVFEALLRFVYTGRVEQLEERAEELLVLGHRYGLELLKVRPPTAHTAWISMETIKNESLIEEEGWLDLRMEAGVVAMATGRSTFVSPT